MNPKVCATVINERDGILELAMVIDGRMMVYDLPRHVAAAMACRVTETLAKPYFLHTVQDAAVRVKKVAKAQKL